MMRSCRPKTRPPSRRPCKGDPCNGQLSLTARATERRRARGAVQQSRPERRKRKRARRKTALVGKAEFKLAEGQTRGTWVRISRKGRVPVKRVRGKRLRVLAKAEVGPISAPTAVARRTLILKGNAPQRKHKRRR
jgi:hypothetical protein